MEEKRGERRVKNIFEEKDNGRKKEERRNKCLKKKNKWEDERKHFMEDSGEVLGYLKKRWMLYFKEMKK